MDNRLNIGSEVRELKLGSTFTNSAPSNVFHTIKYDFKPASVDVNKPAVLEVSANKQVTVTVPHLDGSGVPNTVFKGNHRDYSRKECVLIMNRATGEITLEQLNSGIVVKKTRIENKVVNPPPPLPTIKVENNTARQSSKTKITTGVRKNAPISFVPKHSPLQGSPSYPHRSPQSAPAWNANNTQQTLPSIPMIGLDDGLDFGGGGGGGHATAMPPSSSSISSSSSAAGVASSMNNHHLNNNNHHHHNNSGSNNNHHQQHQQQHHHHQHNNSTTNNHNSSNSSTGSSGSSSSYLNHSSGQNNHHNNSSSSGGGGSSSSHHNNHLSAPSSYGGGRNHLHPEPPPPSVEVSLPPLERNELLLLPPPAVTGLGTGGGVPASSDPEMMTSSESDGSDDSDSSSSDQESDSSTEDNNDSPPVKESIFDPRPDLATVASVAAVDLSKDLCLSSNSDSDD
ncbi:ell-associated factor Eaf [Anopheles bellator]|uniref:ell-associated factor Eaf n=1 Tax=Anopheles bellator TaxID=139047 RepID=UPI00264921E7|nr:ell-associated factor Eaf [Anopheles bellator]